MSRHYIKNKGSTQTVIKGDNGKPIFNNINWDVNYNGENAKIKVDINDNGEDYKVRAKLDNNDLAQLLNVPALKGDLDTRLLSDFSDELPSSSMPIPMIEVMEGTSPSLKPKLIEEQHDMALQMIQLMPPDNMMQTKIPRSEKLRPNLKYQPFLRPMKKSRNRNRIRRLRTKKMNSLIKQLESEIESKGKPIGKTAASKYRTPLPQTMRIHLTSPLSEAKSASKSLSKSSSKGRGLKKTKKHRKSRASTRHGLFRNLF